MCHAKFDIDNTVMRVVELLFKDSTWCLTNEPCATRYNDTEVEDIACLHMQKRENPYPVINIFDNAVEATINKVSIITDTVHAPRKDGNKTYTNTITDGMIFTFTDGHELRFERYDNFIEG